MDASLTRRIVAEAVGTAMLVAAVVGSGIMADRLSGGNQAIALLANAIATGAVLVALILTFGPISGGHFNPAVTVADASQGGLAWRLVTANPAVTLARALSDTFAGIGAADVPAFVIARFIGAMTATLLFRWLVPALPQSAERVVVPRSEVVK